MKPMYTLAVVDKGAVTISVSGTGQVDASKMLFIVFFTEAVL
ncbi:MAG: hypothetical protein NUV53_02700 [Patescibacteria group bacterium]|nr:hypothetical protein [Patescibacteria group bacterium]